MNYKNLIFSIFFIFSLGCVPSTPAMETKPSEQQVNTLLSEAYRKGNFGLVKYLIEKNGAQVNTLIFEAYSKGNFGFVKCLIENGVNVNTESDGKVTLLFFASVQKKFEFIKYLIEKGANIDQKDKRGMSPLHIASSMEDLKIVKYLIEKGANINAEGSRKWTPLHYTCQNGHLEGIKCLIEKGANVNAESDKQETPLHMACQKGRLENIKYLIEKGANVHAETDMKCTLLHIAARNDHIDIVEYLLNSTPELINVRTIDDLTALDIAYEQKNQAVLKLFAQHGVRTVSEKQAEENMRAFFAELDKEASQVQSKSAQKKQKKLENQQRRALENQNSNTNVVKQNNGGVSQQVSKAIEMSPVVINSTINDSVNNDVKPIILADKQIEANAIALTSSEPNSIIACEPAIIVSTANAIHNFSSKANTICSPGSCINNSSASDNAVIITPKKQQNIIQKPNNKPVQPNQPRQINNGYQVGHDAKLKWPRSLAGAKYDLMRDHLRQLKHWPETTGLDIKQLKGQVGMFRLRVGGYRVLFTVNEAQRRIVIHEIGLRKKVYRGL